MADERLDTDVNTEVAVDEQAPASAPIGEAPEVSKAPTEPEAIDEPEPEASEAPAPVGEVPAVEAGEPQATEPATESVPVVIAEREPETQAEREVRERLARLEADEQERFAVPVRESPQAATTTLTKPPAAAEAPAQARPSRTTVLLLGSGELGLELTLAFQRLGVTVVAVDSRPNAPAHRVADRVVVANLTDAAALAALVERETPDYVVADAPASEGVAIDALIAVSEAKNSEVVPTARSTRLSLDREGLRRLAADELGLPTSPFWFAGSVEELRAVAEHAGFPLLVKPAVASDAEGQSVLLRPDDIEPAWHRAIAAGRPTHNRVLVETVVEIDHEVTLLTVRSGGQHGPSLQFCEPIGHRQGDGGALQSWQPQTLTPAALDAAKSIAARIVNALGGRGVYGVELLIRGDEVYFADISARPHDTGLVTLRTQRLSEFELHARAILGLPLDTIMITPGAAEVVYGRAGDPDGPGVADRVLTEALGTPESDVRLFAPEDGPQQRRVGVAMATAADVATARERVGHVAGALRTLK